MDCERAMNWISAQLDSELKVEDRILLDAHLAQCAECRAVSEAFQAQDSQLRRAFASRKKAAASVAERAIAEIQKEVSATRRTISWLPLVLATAAGFLLAVLLFEVWTPRAQKVPGSGEMHASDPYEKGKSKFATLSLATGPIEVWRDEKKSWEPLATGASVQEGWKIRTGPKSRCEFLAQDGSELRLNVNSEILFNSPRSCALLQGQFWASMVPAPLPLEVNVAAVSVIAPGTQFHISRNEMEARLFVVQGSAKVSSKSGEQIVRSGEYTQIKNDEISAANVEHDFFVVTRWVNELLVLKGRNNEELNSRVDTLLAQIGRAKMSYFYEEEIRSLGDHCVLPLAKYIESEQPKEEEGRKLQAARILSDIAPPWAIPELIQLLNNENGEIRFFAAKALERVTGNKSSRTPEQWRDTPLASCSPNIKSWGEWWAENHDRFPRPLDLKVPEIPQIPAKPLK